VSCIYIAWLKIIRLWVKIIRLNINHLRYKPKNISNYFCSPIAYINSIRTFVTETTAKTPTTTKGIKKNDMVTQEQLETIARKLAQWDGLKGTPKQVSQYLKMSPQGLVNRANSLKLSY